MDPSQIIGWGSIVAWAVPGRERALQELQRIVRGAGPERAA